MLNLDEGLIQLSENAEVRYYQSGAVKVDNYDLVDFEIEQKYQASVVIDKLGNVSVVPFGVNSTRRGPRSITLCDTGVAKACKSPKGENIRITVILGKDCATERNFRDHINNLFELIREKGINLKEA